MWTSHFPPPPEMVKYYSWYSIMLYDMNNNTTNSEYGLERRLNTE